MSAAQFILFFLGEAIEPVIALAGRTSLILVHTIENAKDSQGAGSNLATEVDSMAGVVFWGVGLFVRPSATEGLGWGFQRRRRDSRGHDAADGTEGNDVGGGNGADRRTG